MNPMLKHGINHRQHIQTNRIKQGVKNGQINKNELQDLRQARIEYRQAKSESISDGVIKPEESKSLHQALNESSQAIFESRWGDIDKTETPRIDSQYDTLIAQSQKANEEGEMTTEELAGLDVLNTEFLVAKEEASSDGVVTQEERKGLQQLINGGRQAIFESIWENSTPKIDTLYENLLARSQKANDEKKMTPDELERLMVLNDNYLATKEEYGSDGITTVEERKGLRQLLQEGAKAIFEFSHNDEIVS